MMWYKPIRRWWYERRKRKLTCSTFFGLWGLLCFCWAKMYEHDVNPAHAEWIFDPQRQPCTTLCMYAFDMICVFTKFVYKNFFLHNYIYIHLLVGFVFIQSYVYICILIYFFASYILTTSIWKRKSGINPSLICTLFLLIELKIYVSNDSHLISKEDHELQS
jgi:hypothetical protein